MTTGRGLSAGRPWAAGRRSVHSVLARSREPARPKPPAGRLQLQLRFPPACPRFGNMTGNWFIATYYFGFFGYSRWGPGSRVQ